MKTLDKNRDRSGIAEGWILGGPTARPAKLEQNPNSNTASIPPAIHMKTNGRNSPNTGKLQFAVAQGLGISLAGRPAHAIMAPACRQYVLLGGWVEQQKGEENRNSTTASIVPAMYMKTNDGDSPNPGKLPFL